MAKAGSDQPFSAHHPGISKRRAKAEQKGRHATPDALDEIRGLLANQDAFTPTLRADLLIEYLHAIQDHYGALSRPHLVALAELTALPLAAVYEVATFYHNFDVLDDDQQAPSQTIKVCDSLTCMMKGADNLAEELTQKATDVRILPGACMGRCDQAPVVRINQNYICNATPATVQKAIAYGKTSAELPQYQNFDDYEKTGGYGLLHDCLSGARSRDDIISALDESGLRGLGGAGFPTGRKWRMVAQEPGPRLMAVNGDESEPGTFKDRYYLLREPHRFLEGMLIGAWAVEAAEVYIYLRDEYPDIRQILTNEIARLAEAGLLDSLQVHLRRGAGAYICGEESAMLESLEGKRGLPRHKPPFPSQVGLFGRPTLINNVETLFWIPTLINADPEAPRMRSYSVSGRVRNPGVVLAPAGTTVRQLIDDHCGGMEEGHAFKAYLPGGASGGILPASKDNIPLDFGTLEPEGCFIGSAAIIILSDQDDMRHVARNLMTFFEDESCGQCTPCRVGTEKALALMGDGKWDADLLQELGSVMTSASICGLGQAAPNPLMSALKHFADEIS